MRNKRIYLSSPHMGGGEQKYIQEAFDTNWIAPLGNNVEQFEKSVSEYIGGGQALALSSGTAALHLALRLLGIERGDIVFCSTLTFVASANPILYENGIPVFIDSEPNSWNMSPQALEKAMKSFVNKGQKPKAVIVVNLYGQSADYDSLLHICEQYEVPLIEDAAESLGASYKGKMSGSFGLYSIFSFNGNKIITTSGGGMLITHDPSSLDKARFWATQSRDKAKHYQHSEIGYNYRLSNILAGIGRGQMEVLNERVTRKRQIHDHYLKRLELFEGVSLFKEQDYGRSTYWLSNLILDPAKTKVSPEQIIDFLMAHNIESRPIWKPLHLQPLFKNCNYYSHIEGEDISADIFSKGLCLPSDTNMNEEEQGIVIDLVESLLL